MRDYDEQRKNILGLIYCHRLFFCNGLIIMVVMSVFVHQVAYAMDNKIENITAATSLAVVSFAGFFGQFFFGWFSDRLRDPKYAYFMGIVILLSGACCNIHNYSDIEKRKAIRQCFF
jgi:MFS family permease